MKIKASWVAFVPLTVGAVLLHLYHLVFAGGDEITQPLFGKYALLINQKTEPEIIVFLAAVLFLFTMFFSLIDRKTYSYCDINSDPMSGIFLLLSGLLLGVDSAVSLMTGMAEGNGLIMEIIGLLTALLFAVVGMGLLVGFNVAKKIRLFMLLPTIWGAAGMINVFISHRKEAPSLAFFDVFAWVFMTAFLFSNAMVLSGVEIKNPVKSSFVYGMTFVLFSFVYVFSSVNATYRELGRFDVGQVVPKLLIGMLGLYALFSLFKLSSCMITKAKAAEIYYDDDSEEDYDEDEEKEGTEDKPEAAFGVGSTKYVTAEFEKIRMEKAAQKVKERTTGNLPNIVAEHESEDFEEDESDTPMSTLDKIDQLIMELSDDSGNNGSSGSAESDNGES